ncbi:MAG TPA: hypothetical protein VKV28_03835 [Candidatus Binataceae bacterium]|nr:hypothetical protein [Candidatus Binataceae bacterium]
MTRWWRVRNFERFQHYKDRNPPWIRLYGALWRDRAFFRLPDAAKAHLIGLFSLAARLDNRIPNDPDWLAHELCASQPIDLQALAQAGFLLSVPDSGPEASAALASGAHDARRSDSDSELSSAFGSETSSPQAAWRDSCESQAAAQSRISAAEIQAAPASGADARAKAGSAANSRRAESWPPRLVLSEAMREFAQRLGIEPDEEFAAWRDDCAAHARRYVDWEAAWRNRCRNAVRFGRPPARASPAHVQGELPLKRQPNLGLTASAPVEMALRRLREAVGRQETEEEKKI